MAKTLALLFLIGLMVSCSSYRNERHISSVEATQEEKEAGYRYERGSSYR